MKAYVAPFAIDFDVTLKCNQKCLHCNVRGGEHFQDEMNTGEIKTLVQEFYDIGVYDLAITGGEPLMRHDWQQIVEFTCSRGPWKTVINTNGILWTESDMQFVSEKCPELRIVVSLDGYTPETYGILRKDRHGAPNVKEFNKVIDNLQKMHDYNLYTNVNFTVTRLNKNYLFNTLEFARKLHTQGFLAIKFFPYGRGGQNLEQLELPYNDWKTLLLELTKMKEEDSSLEYFQVSVTCPWEYYLPLMSEGYTVDDIERIWNYITPLGSEVYRSMRDLGCNAGVTTCALSPNGDVFPCGTVSARVPGLFCGNARERGLSSVWKNSEMFHKLRQLNLSEIRGACTDCEYKDVCGGGCRSRAFVQRNDLRDPDPLCPFNQNREIEL
ncbi:MAG: SPASM domain-containing protein [Theionarchaea archaeon]|nr:SPASM domain-containing protein [Theionarchaea archaeon]